MPIAVLDEANVARVQGGYFLGTGIWPLLHYRSFEGVTGPKREPWLVKTVGVLVGVVGGTLLWAASRRCINGPIRFLGAGTALALGAVESFYAGRRRISPVYLADAVLEAALVFGWFWSSPHVELRRETTEDSKSVSPRVGRFPEPRPNGAWDIAPGESLRSDGRRDVVDEAVMQSFPASDPPSSLKRG
jgi:hypothetical protein